jgi:hypothetical protein
MLQKVLMKDVIEGLSTDLYATTLYGLFYAQQRNADDVVQLFLNQILGLVRIAAGPTHPIFLFTKNLKRVRMTSELVERLLQANMDVSTFNADYGPMFMASWAFDMRCEILGERCPLQEAERVYASLMRSPELQQISGRWLRQSVSASMADVYLKQGRYAKAVATVDDAVDDWSEWVQKGWVMTTPRTAPLTVTGIIMRLTILAQAQAGLGKHEATDRLFRLAIFVGEQTCAPERAIKIRAQKAYAAYLVGQGRVGDSEAVELQVDEALRIFMLKK